MRGTRSWNRNGTWATQVEQAVRRIESGLHEIYPVAQGGTAVDTGINVPEGFVGLVCERLARQDQPPSPGGPDYSKIRQVLPNRTIRTLAGNQLSEYILRGCRHHCTAKNPVFRCCISRDVYYL